MHAKHTKDTDAALPPSLPSSPSPHHVPSAAVKHIPSPPPLRSPPDPSPLAPPTSQPLSHPHSPPSPSSSSRLPDVPHLPSELIDLVLRTAILATPATPTLPQALRTLLLVQGGLATPTYQLAMLRLPHAGSMDTAAGLGRTDVLRKRRELGLPVDPSAYSAVAIDIACELGHVHVLDWFEQAGLPLVRSSIALMSASLRAQLPVLEWWRARDSRERADHPHSLPSLAGYSAWVASRVGELRSVRWWAEYAASLAQGDQALADRVLVEVLDASLHAATFFGHVNVLEFWAQRYPRWIRHLVDPAVDVEWGAHIPAFARLEDAAAAAAGEEGGGRQPTFMMRWWQRLLGQVGDNEYYFRSPHSQARKELVKGLQWWVHRATAWEEDGGLALVTEAALEHLKQACLRFAPAKVLRRVVREPKREVLEGLDGNGDGEAEVQADDSG